MRIQRLFVLTAMTAAIAAAPAVGAFAMTSGGDSPSNSSNDSGANSAEIDQLYAQAQAAIDTGSYQAAMVPLQSIVAMDSTNADAFNLLGYASRSLQQYNESMDYYQQALAIDPEHLGANEYYGELMLTLGNLPAAEERLALLDEVCFLGCDEFDALEAAIDAYMTAE